MAVAQTAPSNALEAAAMSVPPGRDVNSRHDDRTHPLGDARRSLRQRALQQKLTGKAPGTGKVHRVAQGQYVELEREGEDLIWTVIGEFGSRINPTYGGSAGYPNPKKGDPARFPSVIQIVPAPR